MKWWGWGEKNRQFQVTERPRFIDYLFKKQILSSLEFKAVKDSEWEKKALPKLAESKIFKLSSEAQTELHQILSKNQIQTSDESRFLHSFGKSYRDLVAAREGALSLVVDAVFFPKSNMEVSRLLVWAEKYGVAVVPFGGGTSVVGGLDALTGKHDLVISLSLREMNRILSVDKTSLTARVQAGILGPELEDFLSAHELTFGHFPQSFEFSTLGGWIVTRSSGQNSIYYGGIEKRVEALTVATPQGLFSTFETPREAAGPEIQEIISGSEGTLGIVTEAVIRVSQRPKQKKYFLTAFASFEQATQCARELVQIQIGLHMIRVSDEEETAAMKSLDKPKSDLASRLKTKIAPYYFSFHKISFDSFSSMMIGIEGNAEDINYKYERAVSVVRGYGGVLLGESPGQSWLKHRFFLPYLRDELMDQGVLIETLETSTTWKNLPNLYATVREALKKTAAQRTESVLIFTHISHVYTDGASLYFTFMVGPSGKIGMDKAEQKLARWEQLKLACNKAIQSAGGSASHHHGIGVDHKDFMKWSKIERDIIIQVKESLDPKGVMNPGKLF